MTEWEQQLTSIYSDSTVSFLYNKTNSNKYRNKIYDLDLPHGLIDLLIQNYLHESLVNTSTFELANILGIDQDLAAIIVTAANKKSIQKKTHYVYNILCYQANVSPSVHNFYSKKTLWYT
jgi:hypothetical protein